MNSLKVNAAHVVMATIVIGAVIVLTLHGSMSGETASAIIIAVGGFSMGGGVASSSAGAPTLGLGSAPVSTATSSSGPTNASQDSTTTTSAATPTNPGSVV